MILNNTEIKDKSRNDSSMAGNQLPNRNRRIGLLMGFLNEQAENKPNSKPNNNDDNKFSEFNNEIINGNKLNDYIQYSENKQTDNINYINYINNSNNKKNKIELNSPKNTDNVYFKQSKECNLNLNNYKRVNDNDNYNDIKEENCNDINDDVTADKYFPKGKNHSNTFIHEKSGIALEQIQQSKLKNNSFINNSYDSKINKHSVYDNEELFQTIKPPTEIDSNEKRFLESNNAYEKNLQQSSFDSALDENIDCRKNSALDNKYRNSIRSKNLKEHDDINDNKNIINHFNLAIIHETQRDSNSNLNKTQEENSELKKLKKANKINLGLIKNSSSKIYNNNINKFDVSSFSSSNVEVKDRVYDSENLKEKEFTYIYNSNNNNAELLKINQINLDLTDTKTEQININRNRSHLKDPRQKILAQESPIDNYDSYYPHLNSKENKFKYHSITDTDKALNAPTLENTKKNYKINKNNNRAYNLDQGSHRKIFESSQENYLNSNKPELKRSKTVTKMGQENNSRQKNKKSFRQSRLRLSSLNRRSLEIRLRSSYLSSYTIPRNLNLRKSKENIIRFYNDLISKNINNEADDAQIAAHSQSSEGIINSDNINSGENFKNQISNTINNNSANNRNKIKNNPTVISSNNNNSIKKKYTLTKDSIRKKSKDLTKLDQKLILLQGVSFDQFEKKRQKSAGMLEVGILQLLSLTFCSCRKKERKKNDFLEKCQNLMSKYLDYIKIIELLKEFNRIKKILFSNNQLKLFSYLPNPIIKYKNDDLKLDSFYKDLFINPGESQKFSKLLDSYVKVLGKQSNCPYEQRANDRIIELMDSELKKCFDNLIKNYLSQPQINSRENRSSENNIYISSKNVQQSLDE